MALTQASRPRLVCAGTLATTERYTRRMAGDDSLQRAVDLAFARLAREGYEALTPAQRALVCVWAACGEIDNVGLDQ